MSMSDFAGVVKNPIGQLQQVIL